MNSVEEQRRLRLAFEQANAIGALEGGVLTNELAELQEEVIAGVVSFEGAIARLKSKYDHRCADELATDRAAAVRMAEHLRPQGHPLNHVDPD